VFNRACILRRVARVGPNDTPIPGEEAGASPLGIEIIEGPGFEHLICHSDCTGFYLPIPFRPVIVLPSDPRWDQWGPWLGSSYTLLDECERLSEVLRYPRDWEIEALREQEPDSTAADWRRYAIECFMCQVLITACRLSIESGCAIVYC